MHFLHFVSLTTPHAGTADGSPGRIKKKEEELRDAPTDAFKFGKPPTASSAGDVSDSGSVASHRSRSSASSWDDGKSAEASVASTTKRGASFSLKYTNRNRFSDTCCRSLG